MAKTPREQSLEANEIERQKHLARITEALRKIKSVRPFEDDDAFNEYAVMQLERGEEVCGVHLVNAQAIDQKLMG